MALCQPLISPTLWGCGWPPSHWCRVVTASSVFLVASVCHAFYLGWVGNSLTGFIKVVCVFILCLFGTGGRNVTAFHWCMQSNLSDLPGTARVIFDRFHLKEQERLGGGQEEGGPFYHFIAVTEVFLQQILKWSVPCPEIEDCLWRPPTQFDLWKNLQANLFDMCQWAHWILIEVQLIW